jgi:predicted RNA binding protein YcfA (HicA-like mRNA interferase family)
VSRLAKLLEKLLSGTADASFAFDDLRHVLLRLGFDERIHGSHHVYRCRGARTVRVVLQPSGKDAKPYQVKQVRDALRKLNAERR